MESTRKRKGAAHPVVTVDAGSWRWACAPKWQALISETAEIPWESLPRHAGAELLTENELRSVWRVPIGEQVVVAKVFRPFGGWARLKARLFGPPGKREFEAAQFGQAHQLSVVRPVAYGSRAGDKTGIRVLLTEEIPDAQSLSAYWLDKADSSGGRTPAIDNAIVTRAAAFLESLHRAGFVPADLHPENILVDRGDRLVLVDLHKARFGVQVTEVLRISADQIEPPSNMIAAGGSDYIVGIAKLESKLVLLLDLERVLTTVSAEGSPELLAAAA